jgi:hypothetical protein
MISQGSREILQGRGVLIREGTGTEQFVMSIERFGYLEGVVWRHIRRPECTEHVAHDGAIQEAVGTNHQDRTVRWSIVLAAKPNACRISGKRMAATMMLPMTTVMTTIIHGHGSSWYGRLGASISALNRLRITTPCPGANLGSNTLSVCYL